MCHSNIFFFFSLCSLTSHNISFFLKWIFYFFFAATSYAVYLIILCSIEIIIKKKNSREKWTKIWRKKNNLIHFIQEIIFYTSSITFLTTLFLFVLLRCPTSSFSYIIHCYCCLYWFNFFFVAKSKKKKYNSDFDFKVSWIIFTLFFLLIFWMLPTHIKN